MNALKLSELPIPQSGCGNTRLVSDGVSLNIEFEYRAQGQDLVGCIEFESVVAYRFRNEMHSRGYSSDAYESLVEIAESPWKEEVSEIAPSGIGDVSGAHHYALFLSSNGYFEILAHAFCVQSSRAGRLD